MRRVDQSLTTTAQSGSDAGGKMARMRLLRLDALAERELLIYYLVVGLYFFAFGLQFVLFPLIVTFVLDAPPALVGLAQSALLAPMFVLLLPGGLLAERAHTGRVMAAFYLAIGALSFVLAAAVWGGALNYTGLLIYALGVGSCAALLQPVRDSALNGVVERVGAAGRAATIATAAALTTAVQIGAQIGGILLARSAGGDPAPYLVLQGGVLILGAVAALLLRAPKPERRRSTLRANLREVRDGIVYVFRNPVMGPMMISALYSGVFIIGSFQVLFPLIVRDEYGGSPARQAELLATLFACFWAASFVSAVVLARIRPLKRPGRAMLLGHMIGAAALMSFAWHKPFLALALIVIAWGLAAGVWISTSRTIAQSAAAPDFLGRVLAIYSMGFMGGAPIGSALTGLAAARFGAPLAALLPGLGLLCGAVSLALFTSLWRLDTGVRD